MITGAETIKFEIKRSQLGNYYFRLFFAYCKLNGHLTMASAGRDLIVAGLRSKDKAGLLTDKIKAESESRGISENEYIDMIMAEGGYPSPFRDALVKHKCKSFEELLKKLDS